MLLCTKCGAEEVDLVLPVAAPAKTLPKKKAHEGEVWQWSQVSQRICPVCGAVHVGIVCERETAKK